MCRKTDCISKVHVAAHIFVWTATPYLALLSIGVDKILDISRQASSKCCQGCCHQLHQEENHQ